MDPTRLKSKYAHNLKVFTNLICLFFRVRPFDPKVFEFDANGAIVTSSPLTTAAPVPIPPALPTQTMVKNLKIQPVTINSNSGKEVELVSSNVGQGQNEQSEAWITAKTGETFAQNVAQSDWGTNGWTTDQNDQQNVAQDNGWSNDAQSGQTEWDNEQQGAQANEWANDQNAGQTEAWANDQQAQDNGWNNNGQAAAQSDEWANQQNGQDAQWGTDQNAQNTEWGTDQNAQDAQWGTDLQAQSDQWANQQPAQDDQWANNDWAAQPTDNAQPTQPQDTWPNSGGGEENEFFSTNPVDVDQALENEEVQEEPNSQNWITTEEYDEDNPEVQPRVSDLVQQNEEEQEIAEIGKL